PRLVGRVLEEIGAAVRPAAAEVHHRAQQLAPFAGGDLAPVAGGANELVHLAAGDLHRVAFVPLQDPLHMPNAHVFLPSLTEVVIAPRPGVTAPPAYLGLQ